MSEPDQRLGIDNAHVVCAQCQSVVRVPRTRLEQAPHCPHCHALLFAGHPFALTSASFEKHVQRSDLPLVVDVWAPWCGPCRAMAPQFETVASQMEPQVRFAKLNSDDEPRLATELNIRSIPTLIVFRDGKELARQSGAMDANRLKAWLESVSIKR